MIEFSVTVFVKRLKKQVIAAFNGKTKRNLLQKAPPACDKQKEKWIQQKSDHQYFDFTLHILSLLH